MKNRTLLSFLIATALLYYAFPQLPLSGDRLEVAFSFGWLAFAIIVIGGNLAEYLYQPSRKKQTPRRPQVLRPAKQRQRLY